jgi:hypothetical protein
MQSARIFDLRDIISNTRTGTETRARFFQALRALGRGGAPVQIVPGAEYMEEYPVCDDLSEYDVLGSGTYNTTYVSPDGEMVVRSERLMKEVGLPLLFKKTGRCYARSAGTEDGVSVGIMDEFSKCNKQLMEMIISWWMQQEMQPKLGYTIMPTLYATYFCRRHDDFYACYKMQMYGTTLSRFFKTTESRDKVRTDPMFWVVLFGFIVGSILHLTLTPNLAQGDRYIHFDMKKDNLLVKDSNTVQTVVQYNGDTMESTYGFRIIDFGISSLYVHGDGVRTIVDPTYHERREDNTPLTCKEKFKPMKWMETGYGNNITCDTPEYDFLMAIKILSRSMLQLLRVGNLPPEQAQAMTPIYRWIWFILDHYGWLHPYTERPAPLFLMRELLQRSGDTKKAETFTTEQVREYAKILMDILFEAYRVLKRPKKTPLNISGFELCTSEQPFWRWLDGGDFRLQTAQEQNYGVRVKNMQLRSDAQDMFRRELDEATTTEQMVQAARDAVRALLEPPLDMGAAVRGGSYPPFLQYYVHEDGTIRSRESPEKAIPLQYVFAVHDPQHVRDYANAMGYDGFQWAKDPHNVVRFMEFFRFSERSEQERERMRQQMVEWLQKERAPLLYQNQQPDAIVQGMQFTRGATGDVRANVRKLQDVGMWVRSALQHFR